MTREDVIQSLCRVVTEVGRQKFKSLIEYDCFCDSPVLPFQSVHPEIIAYISLAVMEKLSKDATKKEKI